MPPIRIWKRGRRRTPFSAAYLGISPRRLAQLIAEGRKPFSQIGADIGATQTYVRVYTEPLIRFLNGELGDG